jgi:hypothetical protein
MQNRSSEETVQPERPAHCDNTLERDVGSAPSKKQAACRKEKSIAAAIDKSLIQLRSLKRPELLPKSRKAPMSQSLRIESATSAKLSQLFGEAPVAPDGIDALC